MKKWILGGLGVLLLLLAVPVVAVGSAFLGNAPLDGGASWADGRIVTVKDGYVACYLVDVGQGRYVLVDACMGDEPVREALAERDASPDDLALILLTHGHSDHVGGVEALPDVPVRALSAELPFLEGEQAYRGPLTRLAGRTDTGVRVADPLADGEEFTVGGTTFEVFAVPGHTPGSAAFLVHDVLLLGDSAGWKERGELVGAPWVFTGDPAQNRASLRSLGDRLAERGRAIEALVPAHTGAAPGLEPLASFGGPTTSGPPAP